MTVAAGQLAEQAAGQRQLGAPDAAAHHHPRRRGDAGVDEHAPVARQADRRDPAVLHAGRGDRVVDGCERRLADVELAARHPVHVRPGRRQDHARGIARLALAPAGDDDAVGRDGGAYPVPLAERGRVGQRRVDLCHADGIRRQGPIQCRQRGRYRRGQQVGPGQRRRDVQLAHARVHGFILPSTPAPPPGAG
jgi:hypothetical protein